MRLSYDLVKRILIATTAVAAATLLLIGGLFVMAAQGTASRRPDTTPAETPVSSQPPTATAVWPPEMAGPYSAGGAWIGAYAGLGAWVDIWDTPCWRQPESTVADMARSGVRTVYLQTGNFQQADQLYRRDRLERFIVAAHKNGMRIVGWYLPNMKPGSVDFIRIMRAVNLRTRTGERFDSVALDIESTDISSEAMRNHGLADLSAKLRKAVGPRYPMGAIIPAPASLAHDNSMWENFPYQMLAGYYDVFLPMGYYTYDGHSASTALSDTRANLAVLRRQPGCTDVAIHLIGGESENSSDDQVRAFVKGAIAGRVLGASLYTWPGTSSGALRALSAINP